MATNARAASKREKQTIDELTQRYPAQHAALRHSHGACGIGLQDKPIVVNPGAGRVRCGKRHRACR